MTNDPIQVAVGAGVDANEGMVFWLSDDRCKIDTTLTRADLTLAVAVLRDTADAIDKCLAMDLQ